MRQDVKPGNRELDEVLDRARSAVEAAVVDAWKKGRGSVVEFIRTIVDVRAAEKPPAPFWSARAGGRCGHPADRVAHLAGSQGWRGTCGRCDRAVHRDKKLNRWVLAKGPDGVQR